MTELATLSAQADAIMARLDVLQAGGTVAAVSATKRKRRKRAKREYRGAVFQTSCTRPDGTIHTSPFYAVRFWEHAERKYKRVTTRCTNADHAADELRVLEAASRERADQQRERARDPFAGQADRPLSEHVAEWAAALAAKGSGAGYVAMQARRVQRVFDAAGFRLLGEIVESAVQTTLAALTDAGRKAASGRGRRGTGRRLSAETRNHHVRALKGFARWAVRDRRTASDPLAALGTENARADRRHDRRELSDDELRRLLAVAEAGPERFGMTGPDRARLYRLAVETGLRARELSTLTWAGLELDADQPTVTVRACYAKNGRADTLPLRPATAATLARWRDGLGEVADDAAVFAMPDGSGNAAKMLRADLDDARAAYVAERLPAKHRAARERDDVLRYQDAAGRFADFHSLRHTFISNLARGGVHPKLAMDLARHSDINLTLARYSHTRLVDWAAALSALPDLSPADAKNQATSGDA